MYRFIILWLSDSRRIKAGTIEGRYLSNHLLILARPWAN